MLQPIVVRIKGNGNNDDFIAVKEVVTTPEVDDTTAEVDKFIAFVTGASPDLANVLLDLTDSFVKAPDLGIQDPLFIGMDAEGYTLTIEAHESSSRTAKGALDNVFLWDAQNQNRTRRRGRASGSSGGAQLQSGSGR